MSARKAFLARTSGADKSRLWEESRFGPLEQHISRMVDESKDGLPKLISTCQTATVILIDSSVRVRNILGTIMRDEEQLVTAIACLTRWCCRGPWRAWSPCA